MTVAQFPPRVSESELSRLADTVRTAGERESISVRAPGTDAEIGSVPSGTETDVVEAVARGRTAQQSWATLPVESRARILRRFHDTILDERATVLDLIQLETGKSRLDALNELLDVANTARYYGHRPALLEPEPRRGAIPFLTRTTVEHPPVGVVGVISPWNYPLTLSIADAIPALLAGNAVVLTPASATPFTALLVWTLLRRAGLPEDVFQVVTGPGGTVGPALIDRVDFVVFTGSTETGRRVASRAGENLIDATLELGGKNPMIVLADADLDRAVAAVIHGSFGNAGQLCLALERLYVSREVFDPFVERLVERIDTLELGLRYDYGPDVGSLIGPAQLATVKAHVEDATESGATVEVGGRHRPAVGPYVYEPTVLTNVDSSMTITREETFGPVVTVEPFDATSEAVEMANETDYGLNASIFTDTPERGRELASRIECGTVNVNGAYAPAWGSIDAPMGGMRDSGIGRRHGPEGVLKYTEARTVSEQRGPSIHPPRWLPNGWYESGMVWLLRLLDRLPGLR
ncbi:succinic semialdehyde dehydrogenase [Halodesulfurarchaeum formicicum]|uniref:Succinic semialdehyde dehydrogenase n=1 Tax=Halodesulfurarchaeum formicicum TaxID=1873524 RepID=A0A1D8S5Q2_9EURY|nr:succinic semialdehyde dehydrogenase [Halodesulfurarchaeum formicicum]AOW80672.1 succinic semialdehyde dehydrogenase [Halodesulfurarchaeum formicicum]